MFSLMCVWINGWVNTRQAGDLRRYRGHYDVIIMRMPCSLCGSLHISWIIFICGTNTTLGETMYRGSLPGQWIKGQGQTGRSNFCVRGGGILVDHRSTISSFIKKNMLHISSDQFRPSISIFFSDNSIYMLHANRFPNSLNRTVTSAVTVKLLSRECHVTSLMRSRYWLREWSGAVWRQMIIWANVDADLCHNMASTDVSVQLHVSKYRWYNVMAHERW